MQRINYNGNYFFRYAICFIGSAILYYGFPTLLTWPLNTNLAFLGFAIFILFHPKGRLICGSAPASFKFNVKQLHVIWLWQLLALVTITALALIIGALFSLQDLPHVWQQETFFTLNLYAKLCVAATITTIVAYIVLKSKRPLTIVPLFKKGCHAASPLVIFGNTWLRDASSSLGMICFCASGLFLAKTYFHVTAISPAAVLLSSFMSFIVFKKARFQRKARQWDRQGNFIRVLLSLSGIFLSCLLVSTSVFNRWLSPNGLFSIGSSSFTVSHAALFFQSLCMIGIAPLIFRATPYCQGMSVRTAILGQCLNPYILVLIISNIWRPWIVSNLATLNHSTPAMHLLALSLFLMSCCYLNSTWFANLLERLFSHEQASYQARMRPFFSHHLQMQLLLWFIVFGLRLNGVTLIFISTVAAGTLLAYFYFYCFFWARTKSFTH